MPGNCVCSGMHVSFSVLALSFGFGTKKNRGCQALKLARLHSLEVILYSDIIKSDHVSGDGIHASPTFV